MPDADSPTKKSKITEIPGQAPAPASAGVVRGYDDLVKRMVEQGWWMATSRVNFPSHWLHEGEQRLDAGYYSDSSFKALHAVRDSKVDVTTLGGVAPEPFYPGRFKRIYAKTLADGTPFLTPSQMMHFRPKSDMYLASRSEGFESLRIQPSWILITRSGTVGRCVLISDRLAGFAVSDDAIRVTATKVPPGYLYAYLSTWMGQALISKDQYGSAIKHLEPHHVAAVPVPLLPAREQQIIHDLVTRAYTLRDEANVLLDEADEGLHRVLRLPPFDESLVPYLSPPTTELPGGVEMPHPRAFSIKAIDLAQRFDASYHVPIARTVVELLNKGKYKPTRLGDMAGNIFIPPRFKRIYVESQHGVPFLQGSHLPQMRPYDLKYISLTNTERLDRWIIHKDWVLVTCSGTIGRVGVASSKKEGWAASQHILRIVPNVSKGHPGYIAAFLSTPYGQHQLTAKIYGGVVDELTELDTRSVWIPDAPSELQEEIGKRVIEAFEKKDEASGIEAQAISRVEQLFSPEI